MLQRKLMSLWMLMFVVFVGFGSLNQKIFSKMRKYYFSAPLGVEAFSLTREGDPDARIDRGQGHVAVAHEEEDDPGQTLARAQDAPLTRQEDNTRQVTHELARRERVVAIALGRVQPAG